MPTNVGKCLANSRFHVIPIPKFPNPPRFENTSWRSRFKISRLQRNREGLISSWGGVYVHMCVYVCISVYMCVYVCVYMCVCMCMYVYVCMCMCVCVYVCMCVCIYVCMYVCIYVCM